jgi:hypothetical protein
LPGAARRSLVLSTALALAACADGPTGGLDGAGLEERILDFTFSPDARIEDLRGDRILVSEGPELWLIDLGTEERRRLTTALDDPEVAVKARLSESGVAFLEPEHVVYESLDDGGRAEVVGTEFAFFEDELIVSGDRLVRLNLETLETEVILELDTLGPVNTDGLLVVLSTEAGGPCLYDGTSTRCWDGPPVFLSWSWIRHERGVLVRSDEERPRSWLFSMEQRRQLPEDTFSLGWPHPDVLCGLDADVGLVASASSEAPAREVLISGAGQTIQYRVLYQDGCVFIRGDSITYVRPGSNPAVTVRGVPEIGGPLPWVAADGRVALLRGGALFPLDLAHDGSRSYGQLEPNLENDSAVWSTTAPDGSINQVRVDLTTGATSPLALPTPDAVWYSWLANGHLDLFYERPSGSLGDVQASWFVVRRSSEASVPIGFTSVSRIVLDGPRAIVLSSTHEDATEFQLRVVTAN